MITIFAPFGTGDWALVNLFLIILGIFLSLGALVTTVQERRFAKREIVRSIEPYEKNKYFVMEVKKQNWNNKIEWLVTANIMSIVSVLMFFFTQSLNHMMVLVDRWTIIHTLLFVMEIISLSLIKKRAAVRFETNNDSCKPFTVRVEKGKAMKKPLPPYNPGYIFAGWYMDIDYQLPWNFSNEVDKNITLYAKWKKMEQVVAL